MNVLISTCWMLFAAVGAPRTPFVYSQQPTNRAFAAPNAARIDEIAAHLPEKPGWYQYAECSAQQLEKVLAQRMPEGMDASYQRYFQDGNRAEYEGKIGALHNQLVALSVGAVRLQASDSRRAAVLKRLSEVVEAVVELRSWVAPAHDPNRGDVWRGKANRIDLTSSWLSASLAYVLLNLSDALPADLVARLRAELQRRTFDSYLHSAGMTTNPGSDPDHRNHWFYIQDNWNAVCHCFCVQAALAAIEDRRTRARFVEAAERAMPYFLAGFYPDGYCFEGAGYWDYGFGNFLRLTDIVRRATDGFVDFSKLSRAKELMVYGYTAKMDASGLRPRFADSGGGRPSRQWLDLGVKFWPEMKSLRDGEPPLRTFFPEAQVYIGRAKGFSFAIKGGQNDLPHCHHDLGSWCLVVGGAYVAGDPGTERYTARTFSGQRFESKILNSYGHPVPRVNGELQTGGARALAWIEKTEFADGKDVLVIDLTDGYACLRGGQGKLLRTVTFDREKGKIEIRDDFSSARPMSFDSPVVYAGTETPLLPSATGGRWHVQRDEIENPGYPTQLRKSVTFDEKVKSATVTWTWMLPKPLTNRAFLENCLDRGFPGLKCGSEKEFADFVRKWVEEHDESGLKPFGSFTEKEKDYFSREAQATLDYKFWECGCPPIHFKDHKIDWRANPTADRYQEWPWQFNRHDFFWLLARDYRANGNEATAKAWVDMMTSWFDQAPCPPDGADVRRTTICWRTIDSGIRAVEWIRQLPPFVRSPSVSDAFVTRYFASVWEHANFLSRRYSNDNFLIHELEAVVKIAALYPFLKGADGWRETALRKLSEELRNQVYPDGFQCELTPNYHNICANKYASIYKFLKRLNVAVPADFHDGIARMYEVDLKLAAPDLALPPVNDSDWGTTAGFRRLMEYIRPIFPNRADIAYYATGGKEGAPRTDLSLVLPYSGSVVFRNSREPDAVWGYFDAGPFGYGHQHEDKLNFLLVAYGKRMITEGGCYAYDQSTMRQYVISARAHNTMEFDGRGQNRRSFWRRTSDPLDRRANVQTDFGGNVEWAESVYDELYGGRLPFVHRRRILFVKAKHVLTPFFIVIDRIKAPDDKEHTYRQVWHLEDCALTMEPHGFVADFGEGTGLRGICSDEAAKPTDMKGTLQDGREVQGWLPKTQRSKRATPTPVFDGTFAGTRRVVTVFYPFRGGACPVTSVTAATDPASRAVTVVLSDGRKFTFDE